MRTHTRPASCAHTSDGSDCNDCAYAAWKKANVCKHGNIAAECPDCQG